MIRDHAALVALLNACAHVPLVWGESDCVLFAADAVKAQTGVDLRPRLGCAWTSERAALRLLAARGGLAAAVDTILTRTPLAHAVRGDIGLVDVAGVPCLVVIEGELVVGPGPNGLVRLQRSALTVAWTIDGVAA